MGILLTGAGSTLSSGATGYINMILDGRAVSDTDAAAFISAASISDSTQQTAIYFLVTALKDTGLWTKMVACYPFVGGNATAHSKDLKAAYNITNVANATWTGMTHNSNGITGNGTSQYGDTGLAPSVVGQNSLHLSMYRRLAGGSSEYTMGVDNGSTQNTVLSVRSSGVLIGYVNDNTGAGSTSVSTTGFFSVSRTSSTSFSVFANSRKLKSPTATSTGATTRTIYLLADNSNGSAAGFSSTNLAFSSIGSGLSDSDAQNLSMIVQSYQTILGRAV